jgi:hypothetical protein
VSFYLSVNGQASFIHGDFRPFFPDAESDPAEDNHINVGRPDKGEAGNQIPAPA